MSANVVVHIVADVVEIFEGCVSVRKANAVVAVMSAEAVCWYCSMSAYALLDHAPDGMVVEYDEDELPSLSGAHVVIKVVGDVSAVMRLWYHSACMLRATGEGYNPACITVWSVV